MTHIDVIRLATVTGGATAKQSTPRSSSAGSSGSSGAGSSFQTNVGAGCVLGAVGASMWGASPVAGCVAGATSGGLNGLGNWFF